MQGLDVSVLTAIEVEYLAVRKFLKEITEVMHPEGTIYERGIFTCGGVTLTVGIAQVGAGNDKAAVETERMVSFFKPATVMFVGVAGGLKDVGIGDVVAASKVYGYERGKAAEEFLTRPEVLLSSYPLVQRAQAEARSGDWRKILQVKSKDESRAFLGPIAAGEKIVASTRSSIFSFLRKRYNDALAVEMEGHGFLQAAYANTSVRSIVVRGISDLIDKKSESDSKGSQETAARNAAAFGLYVLAKCEFEKSKADIELPGQPFQSARLITVSSPECGANCPEEVFEEIALELQDSEYSIREDGYKDAKRHVGCVIWPRLSELLYEKWKNRSSYRLRNEDIGWMVYLWQIAGESSHSPDLISFLEDRHENDDLSRKLHNYFAHFMYWSVAPTYFLVHTALQNMEATGKPNEPTNSLLCLALIVAEGRVSGKVPKELKYMLLDLVRNAYSQAEDEKRFPVLKQIREALKEPPQAKS